MKTEEVAAVPATTTTTVSMKKTEAELVKVVRALNIMFVHATTTFFNNIITPEEWIEGHQTTTKLVPSTSKDPTSLVVFKVDRLPNVDKDRVPKPNLTRLEITPQRLYNFVGAVRKEFTSIHDIDSKLLEHKQQGIPTQEDLLWAETVCRSYNVVVDKNKQIVVRLTNAGRDQVAIVDTLADESNFEAVLTHLQKKFTLIGSWVGRYPLSTISESEKKGTVEVREY
jgi:hypothetical protein